MCSFMVKLKKNWKRRHFATIVMDQYVLTSCGYFDIVFFSSGRFYLWPRKFFEASTIHEINILPPLLSSQRIWCISSQFCGFKPGSSLLTEKQIHVLVRFIKLSSTEVLKLVSWYQKNSFRLRGRKLGKTNKIKSRSKNKKRRKKKTKTKQKQKQKMQFN